MAKQRWRGSRYDKRGRKVEEGRFIESEKIDAFLAAIDAVCEAHGFDIEHEDGHGSFKIVDRGRGSGAIDDANDCTELAK